MIALASARIGLLLPIRACRLAPGSNRMFKVKKKPKITSAEFELQVKKFLESTSGKLEEFKTEHLESIEGTDGTYEIDITVRFRAFGAKFLVLVECKHHKNRIMRDYVQVLHAKQVSLGAQKAMMFSTSGFNEGAVNYALQHGIALIQLASGETLYFTKGGNPTPLPDSLPAYVGWLIAKHDRATDGVSHSLIAPGHPDALNKFLFDSSPR
ncbi:MAG: restriction endonuclease [Acidobacteriia bacterium]|nr:restriction endonuclease [Terriglobia bacterium]